MRDCLLAAVIGCGLAFGALLVIAGLKPVGCVALALASAHVILFATGDWS